MRRHPNEMLVGSPRGMALHAPRGAHHFSFQVLGWVVPAHGIRRAEAPTKVPFQLRRTEPGRRIGAVCARRRWSCLRSSASGSVGGCGSHRRSTTMAAPEFPKNPKNGSGNSGVTSAGVTGRRDGPLPPIRRDTETPGCGVAATRKRTECSLRLASRAHRPVTDPGWCRMGVPKSARRGAPKRSPGSGAGSPDPHRSHRCVSVPAAQPRSVRFRVRPFRR